MHGYILSSHRSHAPQLLCSSVICFLVFLFLPLVIDVPLFPNITSHDKYVPNYLAEKLIEEKFKYPAR
jgi:hypothetical protein